MAGSKTAAKKKKPSAADSQELKRVQAWVADGLKVTDVTELLAYVGQNCQGTSPRLQLLGSVYLLLKKWPSTPKDVTPQLVDQLEQLSGKALKEFGARSAGGPGQKPSLAWAWATFVAYGRLGAAASGDLQKDLYGKVTSTLQPTMKVTDPQGWLDQWQLPQEFPAPAEQDAAAVNPQQLAASLGHELSRALMEAALRTGQFEQAKVAQVMVNALKELAEGKEAPKADAKSGKAAADKKEDKLKDKKDAAAAAKQATAMQLQRETSPKQPQQQKRTKDTDRVKDAALRGTAGDDKAAQELAAHKELVAKAQKKADEVLRYLSESTLGAKFSQEEHISALQSKVAIDAKDFKDCIGTLRRHDPSASSGKDIKKGEVKGDLYEETQAKGILKLCRDQFGIAAGDQEAGKLLATQLEQAVEQGSWLVYTEGEEGAKSGKDKAYFSSLGEFLEHVQKEYLDGKLAQADLETYGMICRDSGPGLLDAYNMDFGDLLADEAARALRRTKRAGSDQANGFHLEGNAWMQAFSEDCPLRRYLLHSNRTPLLTVGDDILPSVTTLPELSLDKMAGSSRPYVAAGFALLQLQRKQIVVGLEDLSTAPDWQVKAYQCLKVLLPMTNSNVSPDPLDYVIFHYFSEVEQPEPTQDLREMLDPDLYLAVQAAAGSAGQAGTSSAEPSFSDGLTQDTVTMLQMLHEAQALAEGPLQLALQVFACKVTGKPLPLPHKQGAAFAANEVAAALECFDKAEALELRSFLLQILCSCFARLPKYMEFLEAVKDQRWKSRYVPVEVQSAGKDNKQYALSRDFYAQACMAAAMPYDENAPCCSKHCKQREVAEADGGVFSRWTAESLDDWKCVDVEGQTGPERTRVLRRYILQAARVTEAQRQKELQPGTQQGLRALTKELFMTSEYDEKLPPVLTPDAAQPRGSWELCRFYLLLASQLAIHRQQLYKLVTYHQQNLDSHNLDARGMRQAQRAVLQQRIAGMYFCYEAWAKWYEETAKMLQKELEAATKAKGQDKAGKGPKESGREVQGKNKSPDKLHGQIEKSNNSRQAMQDGIRQLLKQSDMCAASASALTTSLTDAERGLQQTLELVVRELINAKPAPEALQAGGLRKALQLSRMMLFELDVTIMQYVNAAHCSVLSNMWRFRQPAAAVSLVRCALAQHVLAEIKKQQMDDLIAADALLQEAAKQQPAAGKAAGKKKKKKGPAVQQKKISVHTSDSEASDEEKGEAAAESEGEDAAQQQQQQQQQQPDAVQLDPRFLAQFEEDAAAVDEPSTRSSGSGRAATAAARAPADAAARAAADSGGEFKPVGRAGAAAASQQQQGRGQPPPQQQQQQRGRAAQSSSSSSALGGFRLVDGFWRGPGPLGECAFPAHDSGQVGTICWECGHQGHVPANCTTPTCEKCGHMGHATADCRNACPECFRLHLPPPGGRHFLHCEKCSLFGHVAKFCPRSQCHFCGMYGHPSFQCRFCSQCRKQGHRAADCNAKQCSVCGQWGTGCIPGHCINAAAVSSSSRAVQPRPAAPSSSSSRASVKPPAAVIPMPQNVALLNAAQVQQLPQERRDALVNQLFGCGLDDIAGQLFEEHDKLTELMRVPAAVMQQWLEQPDPGSYVQGMLDHFARTKAGAKKEQQERQQQREQQEREAQQRDQREQQGPLIQPSQLPDAAAALFEAEYPPRAVPGDWRSLSWSRLSDIMNRNGRDRDRFRRARDAACAAAAAAGVTAAAPVRRSSSGVEQQQQQQQPQQQQQQQQRFGGEPSGPRESSSSDAADRDAAGEGAALYDGPHFALPLPPPQQQQDHAAAAAAGAAFGPRPTPQNAMAAILADKRKKLGAQAVPAHLQPHLQPHLQQQQQPGGVSNSYSMPNPQLLQQQQQQQAGVMLPVNPAVAEADRRISSEPLAPWMLWYSMGASRAVHELPESEEKHQLLQAMSRDMSGTYMDLEQFGADVVEMLHRKNKTGAATAAAAADMAAWRQLGQLIVQARDLGHPLQQQQQQQQFPAAAPTPAAAAGGPMLPPHLRGRGGLPPHLQQQQPQQQQQQEDEDSDDDDTLLGMLGVENTPASADGGASTWQSITGHAPEDTTSGADFPPLGAQSISAEDADMARAIAASRANHVPGVSAAGLANQAGEYNCFLNVVVQCLWSCKEFTRAVRNLADHECSHPVVQALLNLFERMEAAESGWKPGQVRAVIDPSELRVALAQHTHFKCQEMNDANELLDTIYECFAQSQAPGETQGSRGILIDGVFGLLLSEKVVCRSCGMETHKVPQHYEHLVVVNSTSLSMLYMMGAAVGMDKLLREMFDQEMKMCDKDEGGCGEPNPRYRELAMNPQVLTLQLVWDQNVSGDEIRNTLSQVEERLDITRMYNDLAVGDVTFRLTSAVAYYGQHYMAFVWNTTHNKWMMLDDANASLVGSWQDVINKCQAGKIQPGVLFYRLMDLSSIPDEAAPVQQQQQQLVPPVVQVPSSSSTSSASHYGAPALGHHPGANAAGGAGHGFPAAMPAAAAVGSSSGLPASSNWGARGRAASQQPPAAAASGPPSTGTPWGNGPAASKLMAAAGFDDADMVGAAPLYALPDTGDSWTYDKVESQADSGIYNPRTSSSGSFSSTAGPPGAPSRFSGSGDGYAASPARSHPTATGPGAAAAGNYGPAGRLAGTVMRDVLGQQGPVGTGPRAASTAPGGLDRNGSGSSAAPGAYAGGRGGGRAGGRGPGVGRGGEEPEWGRVGGRGRGRGRGY